MNTTVSSKGQIVLPAEIRQKDGIEAGQKFEGSDLSTCQVARQKCDR